VFDADPIHYFITFAYLAVFLSLLFGAPSLLQHHPKSWFGILLLWLFGLPGLLPWWWTIHLVRRSINRIKQDPRFAHWSTKSQLRYYVVPDLGATGRMFSPWVHFVYMRIINPLGKAMKEDEIWRLLPEGTLIPLRNFCDRSDLQEGPLGNLFASSHTVNFAFRVSWSSTLSFPLQATVEKAIGLLDEIDLNLQSAQK
jgi:hypothetical protein